MKRLWDEVILIVRAIRRSTELEIAKRERRAEAVERELRRREQAREVLNYQGPPSEERSLEYARVVKKSWSEEN